MDIQPFRIGLVCVTSPCSLKGMRLLTLTHTDKNERNIFNPRQTIFLTKQALLGERDNSLDVSK